MGKVTPHQVEEARRWITNSDLAAAACEQTKLPYWLLVSVLDKESKGANTYGHDDGGALSGYYGEVTEDNFRVFLWLIGGGQHDASGRVVKLASNGVGPMQLTYAGFFTDMMNQRMKPWQPSDNILYGARLLRKYLTEAPRKTMTTEQRIKSVGTKYNGSPQYGDDLWRVALLWFKRVGNADNRTFSP
jgi:hypothetical protein